MIKSLGQVAWEAAQVVATQNWEDLQEDVRIHYGVIAEAVRREVVKGAAAAPEPDGTLCDGGDFVWRRGHPESHESHYAGWKMPFYLMPQPGMRGLELLGNGPQVQRYLFKDDVATFKIEIPSSMNLNAWSHYRFKEALGLYNGILIVAGWKK